MSDAGGKKKERALTQLQQEALLMAEETLFGDTKLIEGYGRSLAGLRKRGLVDGDRPHVYLTSQGTEAAQRLRSA